MFRINTFIGRIFVMVLMMTALPFVDAHSSPRQEILTGPIYGEVLNVLDGDTVVVRLHVWIGQSVDTSIRINGIDTPEMKSRCVVEKEKAQDAKTEMQELLKDNTITLYNVRLAKYAGRVLADTENSAGINIADHMIEKGLARVYKGKKRESWCTS